MRPFSLDFMKEPWRNESFQPKSGSVRNYFRKSFAKNRRVKKMGCSIWTKNRFEIFPIWTKCKMIPFSGNSKLFEEKPKLIFLRNDPSYRNKQKINDSNLIQLFNLIKLDNGSESRFDILGSAGFSSDVLMTHQSYCQELMSKNDHSEKIYTRLILGRSQNLSRLFEDKLGIQKLSQWSFLTISTSETFLTFFISCNPERD